MSLLHKINSDLKDAMVKKEKDKLTAIRAIKTAIKNKQVENKSTEDLMDSEIIQVLVKQQKTRLDSITLYLTAGRPDLVEIEKAELYYIESLLPSKIEGDELYALVSQVIVEGFNNIGTAIKETKLRVEEKGLTVDGKELSQIVKSLI